MQMSRRRRLLLAGLLPVLALATAGLAFVISISREVAPSGSASADTPFYGPTPPVGNQTPFAWVPAQQTRAAQPQYDQVINDIHVGPGSTRRGGPCDGPSEPGVEYDNRVYSASDVKGNPLAIEPKYLPAGTTNDPTGDRASYCRGALASTGRVFYVPADRNIGRFGGVLRIRRYLGEHYATIHLPAQDFGPGTLAGRKAVFVKPTTPDGAGNSAIVVAEPWGVTVLEADGITLAELQRIAEGLY